MKTQEDLNMKKMIAEIWKEDKKFYMALGAAAGVAFFLFNYIFMLNLIPSGSMAGTLKVGDVVFANRLEAEDPKRYDIMVFYAPDEPEKYFIKRVIGLPGETITVENGKVYADGVELDDSFLPEKMKKAGCGTYEVPEDSYFMMGDNRNRSLDSRFWEKKFVPREDMVAKAKCILFPFKNVGSLDYEGRNEG